MEQLMQKDGSPQPRYIEKGKEGVEVKGVHWDLEKVFRWEEQE